MQKIVLFVVVLILLPSCSNDVPKYTRSECITKTILLWDKSLDKEQRRKIMDDILTSSNLMRINKEKLKLLVPAIAFSTSDNHHPEVEFMYSQYRDECENKDNMLMIFLELVKFYVPNLPKYLVTPEVIKPSTKTISLSGKWWIDEETNYKNNN